jgi:predicted alpha/beta hydrolase family esterase
MKTAIILHGMPSKEGYYDKERDAQSNSHWLPWIQHELLLRDILAQTPELPMPYSPVYEDWKKLFEQFDIDEDTILIGHSCGGGFLVRYLSEKDIKVGKVVLVAPWLDPERELKTNMFDFEINSNLKEKVKSLAIFISNDDDVDIKDSVSLIKDRIGEIETVSFEDRGHFTLGDMKTREFPELLDVLLR